MTAALALLGMIWRRVLGSAIGRRVAAVAAALAAVALLLWRARVAGYDDRIEEERQERADAAARRLQVDERVRAASDDQRRAMLGRWVRGGEGE